ncbi:MAG TPA: protein-disulfide reductase DsbD domain-containing protein [Tepidisphaeraceae bacterium]|nr:protein-disulfide reductase DsbD domain-containing protein [Tepidisphaeraceae bacterium]
MPIPVLRAMPTLAVIAICFCLVASGRGEQGRIATNEIVKPTLLADVDAAVPGSTFTLGVRLKIAPRYHTYWINPGEFGNPTRIKIAGPIGFDFGEIQWPLPTRIEHDGSVTFGYENDVLLMIPVKVAAGVPISGAANITADVNWLSCSDACIEGAAKLRIVLPIGAKAGPANVALFDAWRNCLPISTGNPDASQVIMNAVQAKAADGAPLPALTVQWKAAPTTLEWFPVATAAIAVENVDIKQDGPITRIAFKPTIYKPDQIPGGKIDSVLVYKDARGNRHGIAIPVAVKKE